MSKKIVYCTPSLYIPGGVERVLTTKANHLVEKADYDVTIVLTDGKGKEPYYPLSPKVKIIQLDIRFEELWHLSFIPKVLAYLRKQQVFKKKLTETLMELRPDITVSLLRREINFITSIKDGSKKIGEIHINKDHYRNFEGENRNLIKSLFSQWWMKSLIKKLKKLDKFIVLTESDYQSWKEIKDVSIIPNPLTYIPHNTSTLINKQVIAVGRYAYEKGFDMLITCWQQVYKKHSDWTLKIYGTDIIRNFTSLIHEKGLQNTIILMEPTLQIYQAYQESSIYVCSSRFEGFGMTLIEAMSCGVPCVSFDCLHGPRNIITDGKNGYLVESNNIETLAERICHLIENEGLRKEMGKEARKRAEDFTEERIMQQWINLFDSIRENN